MAWNDYWDLTFTYTNPKRSSSYYAPNITYPNGAEVDSPTSFSSYNYTFTVVTANNCSAEPRSYGDYHSDYSFMNGSSVENILQYGLRSTGTNYELHNWLESNSGLKCNGYHYAVPLHGNGNVKRGSYNSTSSFVTEPLTHFVYISGNYFKCGIVIRITVPNGAGYIYPIISYSMSSSGLPGQTTIYGYQKHILKVTNTAVSATSPINPVVTFSTYKQQQQQQVDSAWSSISSLSVPDINSTTKSSAQSTYNSAQSYYNVATTAGSSFTNYSNIVNKYNSIKSAYGNIVSRDNAYESLTGLTTPTDNTVQATAKTTKDTATAHWSTITGLVTSSWSNYNTAKEKYDAVIAGYNNTVTRDTRLTKKADKTELNTANTNARVDYTTPHTRGTADYTSIKSTLTSTNKRLNS